MHIIAVVFMEGKVPQKPTDFHGKLDKWEKWTKPVTLQWQPPSDNGGSPLLFYLIEYCDVSNGCWKEAARVRSRERQWVCRYPYSNRFPGGGEFNFRICAENTYGLSDMVELEKTIRIPGSAPGPVRLLKVTEIGYTHVSLSWLPPAEDSGSPVNTYYCVCKYEDFHAELQIHMTNDTHYIINDLNAGTQYCFQVSAANAWDRGKINQIIVSTKQSTAPHKPQGFEGYVDQESQSVQLKWTPPDDDGGSPLSGYHIGYFDMLEGDWKEAERVGPEAREFSMTFSAGSYVTNFKIYAENIKGCGRIAELEDSIQFQCSMKRDGHRRNEKDLVRRVSKIVNREKKYEENFKTFRSYIERCVTVKDLIAFFDSYTTDQQQHLRHAHRHSPTEAVRQALDYIQEMTEKSDRFQCLISALKDADYPKVAGIVEGKLIPENDDSRRKIKNAYQHIYRMLSTGDVMSYLHAKGVVNTLDCEEIRIAEINHGRAEAAAELLFMLPRRDRDWFGKFIEALISCQQTDLAALIDKDLSEKIMHKTVSMKLDLDWEVRSTGSVEFVCSDSETTTSDNTEPSSNSKFTQTEIIDNTKKQSANLDSISLQTEGHLSLSSMDHSTALHAAMSAHFVKLLDVLIRNNSFEESKRLEYDSKLRNMICDWNVRLDTLKDE